MMLAVRDLIERNVQLSGDVHLCFIADEEGASCGALDYVKKHAPEATLVLESAPLEQICVTHQGFGWLKITTRGKQDTAPQGELRQMQFTIWRRWLSDCRKIKGKTLRKYTFYERRNGLSYRNDPRRDGLRFLSRGMRARN